MSDVLQSGLSSLSRLRDGQTRCITAENVYGEKGRGGMAQDSDEPQPEVVRIGQKWERNAFTRDLGHRWKARPAITLPQGATTTIMDVAGPGIIQHIWITVADRFYRDLIVRVYWDDEATPSVEVPLGDFFCNGFNQRVNILAIPINVNPSGGFNCYFPMPFRGRARITVENRAPEDVLGFFYAITWAQCAIDNEDAYFHASFRRSNPVALGQDHVILDGVRGRGHYVGCYLAWLQNSFGWWGEGEVKMFIDGDGEYPTICGTGTEDYFGGAWCFGATYSAPYLGYPLGAGPEAKPHDRVRHGLYRFHLPDPVRFSQDLRITVQDLGIRSGPRFRLQQDDIASVAYWYQREPHAPFPTLGDRDALEP